MANEEDVVKSEIANAIATLCEKTDSKYVNVFDKSTLQHLDRPAGRERYIVATGSYAFHEWKPEEDVVFVILSRASRSILWQLLEETLLLPSKSLPDKSELEISAHSLSMTMNWEPSTLAKFETLSRKNKGHCKVYLRYCQLPTGFDISTDVLFAPFDSRQDKTIPPSLTSDWNWGLIRDMQFIAETMQCTASNEIAQPALFRTMFRRLRQWAKNCGLYGVHFGFLDSECIVWVVDRALRFSGTFGEGQTIDQVHEDRQFRAVLKFFASLIDTSDSKGHRGTELRIATPGGRIIGRHLTPDMLEAMRSALRMSILGGVLLDADCDNQLHTFLHDFEHYVKVEFSSWETSAVQLAEFEDNYIPATIKEALSHLRQNKCLEHNSAGLRTRLWPEPLAENEQEHRSIFAIGLSRSAGRQNAPADSMARYTSRIAAEISEMVFNQSTPPATLTTVTSATSKELMSILQDAKSDDAAKASGGSSRPLQPAGGPTPATGRFRTAGEAISRLRYDPAHAAVEYDLGYEDRFEGLVWMGLENWGCWATEDENFVAEHRVRLLRRRCDGLMVWDRENRVDLAGG